MSGSRLLEIFAHAMRRADFALQPHVSLKTELWTKDPGAEGAGPWSAADWTRARKRHGGVSATSGNRYGSDEEYRRYLAAIDAGKIAAVRSLLRAFDLGRYPRLIELGCGDMPQAYAIAARFPDLSVTATDFDPHVIEQCANVPMLQAIRKRVLDAGGPGLDEVRNHDLVMSWSLESALDDGQLANVFATCRRHRVPYLLCTHATIGPLEALVRGGRRGTRLIGWRRSVRSIERLARGAGMKLEWKSYHVNHAALFFAPD